MGTTQALHFGGYASVAAGYGRIGGEDRAFDVAEGTLAFLLSGVRWDRLSYFAEVELAGRGSQNWSGREDEELLDIERLYIEYTLNDRLRLRAGRFLTPVGQWNENHADPLTWTPLRPLTTFRPFAKSLTGLMAAGEFTLAGRDAGYGLFWVPPGIKHEVREESEFLGALGLRVASEVAPGTYLGATFMGFRGVRPHLEDENGALEPVPEEEDEEDEDVRHRPLAGLDLVTRIRGVDVRAEAVWLRRSRIAPREAGAFLQAAVPLWGPLYGVARVEYYDAGESASAWTPWIGATARLDRRLTVKAGHQFADDASFRAPRGWFFSVSSLF